ncbi:hypothetical protein HX878_22210 [Pseudomonas veronii]|uniref:hypothetical protein n=1 Tax=Pseudomonas veronii TaxID=76761 RepID=UPI0015A0D903|nr:hypothetical protein [Pseudomonas veronii]NWD57441.1 hypothetical protein [Pseudomonas veronii]
MRPKQKKRFIAICQDMADLIDELHNQGHPDAAMYLEDGTPALYDWPESSERRPEEPLAYGAYWHKSGGGGK